MFGHWLSNPLPARRLATVKSRYGKSANDSFFKHLPGQTGVMSWETSRAASSQSWLETHARYCKREGCAQPACTTVPGTDYFLRTSNALASPKVALCFGSACHHLGTDKPWGQRLSLLAITGFTQADAPEDSQPTLLNEYPGKTSYATVSCATTFLPAVWPLHVHLEPSSGEALLHDSLSVLRYVLADELLEVAATWCVKVHDGDLFPALK